MTTETDDFAAALAAIDNAARADRATEEAATKMGQARIDLVLGRDAKAVFFATVAMRLQLVADREVDTAATNGKVIKYNPEFIAGLDRAEAMGLLAHEVLHVTNAHHARLGDRDPGTWNIACDLAINPMLKSAGVTLPSGGLFPGEGKYAALTPGASAEEYYNELRKNQQQQPEGDNPGDDDSTGSDPGQCGGVEKPGKGSPAECRKAEAEAKEMTAAAEQAVESSGRGDLPDGIGRAVKELLAPKADWRSILREFIARSARNDYSWSRQNRRFVHAGIYLPGLHSEELGNVVLAVDTSGSIGADTLQQFASEVQGILEAYDCSLTVLYHHSAVYKVQEWRSTDGPLVMSEIQSGGTSHVPVFEHIDREQIDAACIVCLTDMQTVYPASDPGIPTLWCNVDRAAHAAPFGRVIQID